MGMPAAKKAQPRPGKGEGCRLERNSLNSSSEYKIKKPGVICLHAPPRTHLFPIIPLPGVIT